MRTDDINGHILGTGSGIRVGTITLTLSYSDAYGLCNLLYINNDLEKKCTKEQADALLRIGRDLGILVDHPSRHNLGKFKINIEKEKY